ncbi:Fic family protein [Nonomuraea sp. SMC257]|uniref:Fic family protein n=1 Tax=Nonomuraea montanisoli TaxID=2741721 RepID=A0A7Y6IER5_9ACTN|nr:Fic family protein [Nonomuraea montanisoli]
MGRGSGGQLHGAVLPPQMTVFGDDACPGPWRKAAAVMQSILIGHPLVDGNKRLAWTVAVAFYGASSPSKSSRNSARMMFARSFASSAPGASSSR